MLILSSGFSLKSVAWRSKYLCHEARRKTPHLPDSVNLTCNRSVQIIVEGILERGTLAEGRQEPMLAGQTFGHESLIHEKYVNREWISCLQPTKLLEISKEHFDRYVRSTQVAEWARVATLVSELSVFNEPSEEWEGNRLDRLLGSLQLQTYRAGDVILSEGKDNRNLMFLLAGHCQVTKYVVDEKLKKRSAKLASPLRSSASMSLASNSADETGGREIDITMLYRGSILDSEAVLDMKAATVTVIAKSQVEVAFLKTNECIFIDDPVSHTSCYALVISPRTVSNVAWYVSITSSGRVAEGRAVAEGFSTHPFSTHPFSTHPCRIASTMAQLWYGDAIAFLLTARNPCVAGNRC